MASDIRNLSITTGSTPPSISFQSQFAGLSLSNSDFDVFDLDGSNGLQTLNLNEPVGEGYLVAPRVDVSGIGSGAEVVAVVDLNVSSANYGKITDLNVTSAGSGYSVETTTFSIVPLIRAIGFGTPAEVEVTFATDFFGNFWIFE